MKTIEKQLQELKRNDKKILSLLDEKYRIGEELAECIKESGSFQEIERLLNNLSAEDRGDGHTSEVFDWLYHQNQKSLSDALLGFNLFLIGFMGVGKSTVAKTMQDLLGLEVLEMDQKISEDNGMSISEIFEVYGETYFRDQETDLLRSLQQVENTIISCGGGAAMRERNVEEMKKSGKVVLLTAEPSTILKRVENNHDRPLLENNKTESYIADLMEARNPAYTRAADMIIPTDGKTALQICIDILAELN